MCTLCWYLEKIVYATGVAVNTLKLRGARISSRSQDALQMVGLKCTMREGTAGAPVNAAR